MQGTAPVRSADAQGNGSSRTNLAKGASESREARIERLRVLWDNRRLLRRMVLCGGALCALVAFSLPLRYEATTKLMPPESPMSGGAGMLAAALSTRSMGGLAGLAGDFLGVKGNGPLFVSILESRTVADRLIEQFHLADEYKTKKPEYTRLRLQGYTTITEDRKSGVITLKVTDHNPRQAAAMAQAYVAELDRLVAQVSTSSARRERIFLEERLRTVKLDLDDAAKQFSEFASKNTAIDIPAQGRAMVEATAMLQGQLIAAESELSGLEKIYTDNNIRVRSLQARVATLREQLQKLGGTGSPDEVKNNNSLYPSIRKLPLLGVTYADLYRRTKIQEVVFELLTQQYELAKVQEAKEIPSVKVLDNAVVPTVKSSPHRLILTVVGTLLVFCGTSAFIFWRKRWNETDPTDPGRVLAEEMATSVLVSARRLAPIGSALQNLTTRARQSFRHAPEPSGEKADAAVSTTHTRREDGFADSHGD